jgi:hypothetical protein
MERGRNLCRFSAVLPARSRKTPRVPASLLKADIGIAEGPEVAQRCSLVRASGPPTQSCWFGTNSDARHDNEAQGEVTAPLLRSADNRPDRAASFPWSAPRAGLGEIRR